MLRRCVPCAPTRVPVRSISRISKAARMVSRDKAPHFTPDGKRIFNVERHLFNMNKRIGWAAEHKKPQEAMQIFGQLKASGVQPDIVSYTSLLKAFVEAKQWTEAETTFKSISQANLKPNAYTYGHMLQALGQQAKTEQILQTAENMRKDGFGTNEKLLQQLMVSLSKAKATAELDKVWEEIKAIKPPSRYSWNTYVLALVNIGDFARAEKAYKEMLKVPSMRPDRETYIYLLSHLVRTGSQQDMAKALSYVSEMKRRRIAVTAPIYHLVMQGWLKLGDYEKAVEQLEQMRKNSVAISSSTFHVLITGCIAANLLPKADVLLLDAIDAHVHPQPTTLKALAAAHTAAGNTKRAEEVTKLVEVYKIVPKPPMPELTSAAAKRRAAMTEALTAPAPAAPQAATQPGAKV